MILNLDNWIARGSRLRNRMAARRFGRAKAPLGFVFHLEPRSIGSFAKGRQLLAGNYMFAGHLIEARGTLIWDVPAPDEAFSEEIHGFGWLDDLAAVGDTAACRLAQDWVWGWIAKFGRGSGHGWTPELTARRLIRLIHHALFLLRGRDPKQSEAFYRSLAQQALFLSKRLRAAPVGIARFEAMTGVIYAGLSLMGMEAHVNPALISLEHECATQVDTDGGIATRNPEELLEVLTLLTWARAALTEAGREVPGAMVTAIERLAPSLRTLRHSDGGLGRFHGGGRGPEGRLDAALAASGVKDRHADGLAMGFARLSAGRTSIIVDAAAPPTGRASQNAHASTLAFELTSGRRPLIVNCGNGAHFGEEWRRAGRATPSHSTLCLDGFSSSRLGAPKRILGVTRELLAQTPTDVPIEISHAPDGLRFEGGHNGYVATHGLTHARRLELTFDGRGVVGEDMLMAISDAEKRVFNTALDAAQLQGLDYRIYFHLHPEVDAEIDLGGQAVSMVQKSGEVWVFRHDGQLELSLEPGVYMERGRLRPRATQQIVLTGRTIDPMTKVRWSLAKAHDSGYALRDLKEA